MTLVEIGLYAALPALISVAVGGRGLAAVLAGGLVNPDSYMRLVRLQQMVADPAHSHVVTRDGSGLGSVIHWSHLVDSLLYLAAAPLMLFMSPPEALHAVAVAFGPVSMAAAGIAIAWAAAPFADRAWLWLAPLGLGLAPAVVSYGVPGVVHHHVAAVIVATMTAGWAARVCIGIAGCRAGWQLGAWAGLGIWLTPETLAITAMAFGAIWIGWLESRHGRRGALAIRDSSFGFLAVVALAWLVDPPHGGYTVENADRLSIVFVALAVALAAIGAIVVLADEITDRPAQRLLISGCSGIMVLVIWIALFPFIAQGTGSLMGAADWQVMLGDITEMRSLATIGDWVSHVLSGVVALVLVTAISLRRRSATLWYLALCAAALVALGWLHVRFASYPEALAAVMLPAGLTLLSRHARTWPPLLQSASRLAMIAVFLAAPLAGNWPGLTSTAQASRGEAPACDLSRGVALLEGLDPQVVLTSVNDTPEVLYRTGMLTVGSLYHRNPAGFMRLRSAWRSQQSDGVPVAFGVAHIGLVLFCAEPGRSALLRGLPADTVMDRLTRNDPPAWLAPLGRDAASGYTLYQVRP